MCTRWLTDEATLAQSAAVLWPSPDCQGTPLVLHRMRTSMSAASDNDWPSAWSGFVGSVHVPPGAQLTVTSPHGAQYTFQPGTVRHTLQELWSQVWDGPVRRANAGDWANQGVPGAPLALTFGKATCDPVLHEQFRAIGCTSVGPTISALRFTPPSLRSRRDICTGRHDGPREDCDSVMREWCSANRTDPACACVLREQRLGAQGAAQTEGGLCRGTGERSGVYISQAVRDAGAAGGTSGAASGGASGGAPALTALRGTSGSSSTRMAVSVSLAVVAGAAMLYLAWLHWRKTRL